MMKPIREYFFHFLFQVLAIIAFLLSLLPLVSWWGGVLALVPAIYFWRRKSKNWPYLISLAAIFLGIIVYGLAWVYSTIKVAHLRNEAKKEMAAIFKNS
ncbi:MAG: hypothetical protein NZM25_10525 [Leptospiraceae bacterium]|nr:hypothetical protein [Leptospiraceae bacterium]MDW8305862.1 hypothetical protein [Leptospiraceae bacterium]